MSEKFVTSPGLADAGPGEQAVSRLADRLAAMAPASPSVAAFDAPPSAPRDLAAAAPAASAAPAVRVARAAPLTLRPPQHAPVFDTMPATPARKRRSRSIIGGVVDGFVSACSFVPYALVALLLRLVMARVFFLDGQTKVDGPHLAYSFHGFDVSVILPMQVKAETLFSFITQHAALPVPGAIAAYLVGYAEFVLPLMLVVGFGTRIAALGLLIMTAVIQVFVVPQGLWTAHVYWALLLLVLLSLGPGKISIDQVFHWLSRRKASKSEKVVP
jgi:putative oxidoreductase